MAKFLRWLNSYDFLKKHPEANRKEIAKGLGDVTESGVKYNIRTLQKKKLLKHVGSDKGGYWEVIAEK